MNDHVNKQFRLLQELYKAAREYLDIDVWDYLAGAAETETTFRRNRAALDMVACRPRVLRDVEHVDASMSLLGHRLPIPVLLAPIGSLQDFDLGGGATAARAANGFGVMSILSSLPRAAQSRTTSTEQLECRTTRAALGPSR